MHDHRTRDLIGIAFIPPRAVNSLRNSGSYTMQLLANQMPYPRDFYEEKNRELAGILKTVTIYRDSAWHYVTGIDDPMELNKLEEFAFIPVPRMPTVL